MASKRVNEGEGGEGFEESDDDVQIVEEKVSSKCWKYNYCLR